MKKIPFEATFTGAYKFTFQRSVSIIGTAWLPTLVFLALMAGVLYLVVPHAWWQGHFPVLPHGKDPDPEQMWEFVGPFLLAYFPVVILIMSWSAMLTVGFMQLVLGQKERCFIFFSLGGDFWRMIGNSLLAFLVLMLMGVLMVAALIFGSIFAGPLLPKGLGALILTVSIITAFCFWIYATVRLTFFLPAVAVAEHQVNLGRAWELAAGNFWRIVGLSALAAIPVAIVAQVAQEILVASPLLGNVVVLSEKTHDLPTILHAALPLAGAFMGVFLLQKIVTDALAAATIAKAYLALNSNDEATS